MYKEQRVKTHDLKRSDSVRPTGGMDFLTLIGQEYQESRAGKGKQPQFSTAQGWELKS